MLDEINRLFHLFNVTPLDKLDSTPVNFTYKYHNSNIRVTHYVFCMLEILGDQRTTRALAFHSRKLAPTGT